MFYFLLFFTAFLLIIIILIDRIKRRRIFELGKTLPGPTAWPYLGNLQMLGLDTEGMFRVWIRFGERYGSIFRLWKKGRLYVVCSDKEDIEKLLTDNINLDKSDEYDVMKPWIGDGLLLANGDTWKRHRKAITPTFYFNSLDEFILTFNKNAKILVRCLENELGKGPFNIHPYIKRTAFDDICETAMGVSYNAQTTLDSTYLRAIKTMGRILTLRLYDVLLSNDFLFNLTSLATQLKEAQKTIDEAALSIIKQRRTNLERNAMRLAENTQNCQDLDKPKTTFIDMLLKSDESTFTNIQIRDEINTFMFEGMDTITSATSFALYELANNPSIQEKLYEEIVTVQGSAETLKISHITEMAYLQKVVKETLRKYPPSALIGRKIERDVTLKNGIIIPKGVDIILFIFNIHRNPEYWLNPDKFEPENFSKPACPFTFIPFSGGSRNCIGQKFALLQIKVLICYVLTRYKLSPSLDPKHQIRLTNELVVNSTTGQHIIIEKRITKIG